ncbi:MAG: hypothetical protein JWQ30_2747 [Sediminibacterium sp.]|nr:hypothetical protein [Sediminibacterium sp.]
MLTHFYRTTNNLVDKFIKYFSVIIILSMCYTYVAYVPIVVQNYNPVSESTIYIRHLKILISPLFLVPYSIFPPFPYLCSPNFKIK